MEDHVLQEVARTQAPLPASKADSSAQSAILPLLVGDSQLARWGERSHGDFGGLPSPSQALEEDAISLASGERSTTPGRRPETLPPLSEPYHPITEELLDTESHLKRHTFNMYERADSIAEE